jgi:hypothetical protein
MRKKLSNIGLSRKSTSTKPKGWRNIVVDDVAYWWRMSNSCPYIKRVSDKKTINTWDHLVAKGWFEGMSRRDISFTPKVVSDIIRELY